MKGGHRQLNTKKDVYIDPQKQTGEGNYIDLQIQGVGWCLIIENKIYHWDANPFTDYENHAKTLSKQTLFSILSRDGHSKDNNGTPWVGVSYKNYCQALRERMPKIDSYNRLSKWQLFAREFIVHMENELYDPPMKPKEVAFVERHADQIADAEKLAAQYREFILQELKCRLEESVPGSTFDTREGYWYPQGLVFYCKSPQWANHEIVLYKPEGIGQKFFIRAYLADLSEPQLSNATHVLKLGQPVPDGKHHYWDSPLGYDSREEAITELCKLAKNVNDLIKK